MCALAYSPSPKWRSRAEPNVGFAIGSLEVCPTAQEKQAALALKGRTSRRSWPARSSGTMKPFRRKNGSARALGDSTRRAYPRPSAKLIIVTSSAEPIPTLRKSSRTTCCRRRPIASRDVLAKASVDTRIRTPCRPPITIPGKPRRAAVPSSASHAAIRRTESRPPSAGAPQRAAGSSSPMSPPSPPAGAHHGVPRPSRMVAPNVRGGGSCLRRHGSFRPARRPHPQAGRLASAADRRGQPLALRRLRRGRTIIATDELALEDEGAVDTLVIGVAERGSEGCRARACRRARARHTRDAYAVTGTSRPFNARVRGSPSGNRSSQAA